MEFSFSLPKYCLQAFSLGLILIVAKFIYRLTSHPLAKFPGPKLGAFTRLYEAYHQIRGSWLENLKALHAEHGPVVRIGPNELHFVDHKWCLEHHRRSDLKKCANYYGLLNTLLGGLHEPHHHAARKSIIQPLFTGQTLAQFSPVLNSHLDTLHDQLARVAGYNDKVNATYYLWAFTNDVMISYLSGSDPGYMRAKDLVTVHDETRAFSAIDLATILRAVPPVKVAFAMLPFLRRLSPLGWLDQKMAGHLHVIQKEEDKKRQTVLAHLWHQLGDEKLVIQEAAQAIFIGNESLLSNLTFLLHHLMQNPECVSKLRAEMDSLNLGLVGHRVWHDPRVLQLPYLDALCRESTRLSSPAWHRQPRQVAEPVMYGDDSIPPMTSLSFTLQLLERDPVLFPEPERFNPDRWLGHGPAAMHARRNSVGFGTGTRTCLGQFIARQVLRKTIAAIIYNFNISHWDQVQDKQEGYRYLDTYPQKGKEGYLNVRLVPRFGTIDAPAATACSTEGPKGLTPTAPGEILGLAPGMLPGGHAR